MLLCNEIIFILVAQVQVVAAGAGRGACRGVREVGSVVDWLLLAVSDWKQTSWDGNSREKCFIVFHHSTTQQHQCTTD